MPEIFICYRRDDSGGHAGRLHETLIATFGTERVFMDLAIEPGVDFREHIERAIDSATIVIALIGRSWLTTTNQRGERRLDDARDFVRLELATALTLGKRVIPTLVGGARPPEAAALPKDLARLSNLHALEISDSRWAFDAGQLVSAITRIVTAPEPAPAPKPTHVAPDARQALARGVSAAAGAIRATLGPNGHYVVIRTEDGRRRRTRDGAAIVREVRVADPFEQEGVDLVHELAGELEREVGSGATTAVLLAEALVLGCGAAEREGISRGRLLQGLKRAVQDAVEALERQATEMALTDQVRRIATIAADGDDDVGAIVEEAVVRVGRDGVVIVEENQTFGLQLELTEGMQLEAGYVSPHMVTEKDRMEAVLEDPYVLVVEHSISGIKELLPILEAVIRTGRPLLILAEKTDGETLATLVVNKLRGTFTGIAVDLVDAFGGSQQLLEDVAILTGTQVIGPTTGRLLESTQLPELGRARRVIVGKAATTIVDGSGDANAIKLRIAHIKSQIETTTLHSDRQQLQVRLAKLSGGVAVVRVGGASEPAMQERRRQAELAVRATMAGLRGGVLVGGGAALVSAQTAVALDHSDAGLQAGATVVVEALEAPLRQLADSAGLDAVQVLEQLRAGEGMAFDAARGRVLSPTDPERPLDPLQMSRLALLQAAALAERVLTTEGVLATHAHPSRVETELETPATDH